MKGRIANAMGVARSDTNVHGTERSRSRYRLPMSGVEIREWMGEERGCSCEHEAEGSERRGDERAGGREKGSAVGV